ncbi:MAG: hypothetical protein JRJ59_05110, partial [Deltaproteobacteria bacterium]|nr:hypothetical protein [Deltaproteobacteria bacterium]
MFDQLFSSEANINFYKLNEKLAQEIREMTAGILEETEVTAELADQTSQKISASLVRTEEMQQMVEVAEWLKDIVGEVGRVKDLSSNLGGSLKEKGGRLDQIVKSL